MSTVSAYNFSISMARGLQQTSYIIYAKGFNCVAKKTAGRLWAPDPYPLKVTVGGMSLNR
jgi:hypothetical protein